MGSERQYLGVWTFINGSKLVVKNSVEVVVPKGERQEILDELHATHMGVEGMKKLARGKMTWKNMTKDIERKYAECKACLVHSRSKPNIPNHRKKLCQPTWSWQHQERSWQPTLESTAGTS